MLGMTPEGSQTLATQLETIATLKGSQGRNHDLFGKQKPEISSPIEPDE
jgi:hypothetical protein